MADDISKDELERNKAELQYPKKQPKRRGRKIDALYTVTMRGLYIGSATGLAGTSEQVEKPYRIRVKMDHETIEKHGPQSAFKRFIAPKVMTKKYPDYKGLRTYEIEETTCDNPDLIYENIQLLNIDQLRMYIDDEGLEINAALYDTAEKLRQAISDYEEDPEGYAGLEKNLADKTARSQSLDDQYKLDKLNKDFEDLNDIDEDLHDYQGHAQPGKDDPISTRHNQIANSGAPVNPPTNSPLTNPESKTATAPDNPSSGSYQKHTSTKGQVYYTDPQGNKIVKADIPEGAGIVEVDDADTDNLEGV